MYDPENHSPAPLSSWTIPDSIVTKSELLRRFAISIDGPSGSGKSTTATLVAERLGLLHLDTGAMYRAITLGALKKGCNLSNGKELARLAKSARIEFSNGSSGKRKIILDGNDVTLEIRSVEVTNNVSLISSHQEVRQVMAAFQRRLASQGGVVLEGRDIGSVILPCANVKIFLVASIDARARRRHLELEEMGIKKPLEELKGEIEERDRLDSTRAMSPLKKPIGSCTIDTTTLTIEGQVSQVIACVEKVLDHLIMLSNEKASPSQRKKIRPYFRVVQFLIRTFSRLFWGMKIIRTEKLNFDENYIFACNHLSYFDPPLVGSTLPREIHFLAKAELFRNRPFAWLIRMHNAIPVRRGIFDREAMDTALNMLLRGKSMLIFPEGTRMKRGELGSPKSGVGYLAINSRVPVVPVYVEGSNRLSRAAARKSPLRVVLGSPIRLTDRDTEGYKNNNGYREYSEMVMEAIAALKESLPWYLSSDTGTP